MVEPTNLNPRFSKFLLIASDSTDFAGISALQVGWFTMVFPPVNNVYAMSSISKSTYEDKSIVTSDYYKKEVRILAKNIMFASKELYKKKAKWIYSQNAN